MSDRLKMKRGMIVQRQGAAEGRWLELWEPSLCWSGELAHGSVVWTD